MRSYLAAVKLAAVLCVVGLSGCLTTQLKNRVIEQAGTIPDVYHQVVLNNLAMMSVAPDRMPYFSDPQTARVEIVRTIKSDYGIVFDTIAFAPEAVLALLNHGLVEIEQTVGLSGEQSRSGEWSALTANDPDKLFTMRAAYHRTLGVASEEDEEQLAEFYYRHFEITDQTLERLREQHPEVYNEIGKKLEKIKGIEYLTVERFEKRLAAEDLLGPDGMDRYRRPLIKHARMSHEPTEFVSEADTHHLLYRVALQPGWYGMGCRQDVPRTACYVGRYCDRYVWVEPQNMEMLTRMTLAILDIHTFRSQRVDGDRVLPGLLPR